jgi:ribonucleoside-diphosphate reductase alpha chain
MKFVSPGGQFDVEAFRHAVDTMILAQEIIVDNASYPTEKIGQNSHAFRPLGLGFANLGALLMSMGVPYDSDQGRDHSAAITAIMCGQAYLTSSRIASAVGTFEGYADNQQPFLEVIRMHRDAVSRINANRVPAAMMQGARQCWDDAYESGRQSGYRNAQVTVIAPTGTIGFMMDCDTTGIEPDLALIKYKKLVGGGVIKIVNNTVPAALIKLGYSPEQVEKIVSHIDSTGTIEGAPELKPEHLPVFDCSFRPQNGTRSIHYMGHVKMMAAVQPFISGAISKTINMPEECTVEDIMTAYTESWKRTAAQFGIRQGREEERGSRGHCRRRRGRGARGRARGLPAGAP